MHDFFAASARFVHKFEKIAKDRARLRLLLSQERAAAAHLRAQAAQVESEGALYAQLLAKAEAAQNTSTDSALLNSVLHNEKRALADTQQQQQQQLQQLATELNAWKEMKDKLQQDIRELEFEADTQTKKRKFALEALRREIENAKQEIQEQDQEKERHERKLEKLQQENKKRRMRLQQLREKAAAHEEEAKKEKPKSPNWEEVNTLRFRLSALQQECARLQPLGRPQKEMKKRVLNSFFKLQL